MKITFLTGFLLKLFFKNVANAARVTPGIFIYLFILFLAVLGLCVGFV